MLANSPRFIFPDPNESYILCVGASKHSLLEVVTSGQIVSVKDKDLKPFLPITNVSRTFIGSQKNWATLMNETYAILNGIEETFILPL